MINPNNKYPLTSTTRLGFLKNFITNPNIIVGDYTYYDDPQGVEKFNENVLYHFDFIGDKLIIGKFCQIATKTKFIMNGANHAMNGFSTFPFKIFGEPWAETPLITTTKGDTIIGNDVWIGYDATIMPGVKIGDGAIIASGALVASDIAPYTIVGGNPAKLIRQRFTDDIITFLCALKWWNWPIEQITKYATAIATGELNQLKTMM